MVGSSSLDRPRGINPTGGLSSKVQAFTLRNVLLSEFRTQLFGALDDDLYNELIVNSTHDL
jgi:hypothetical protein